MHKIDNHEDEGKLPAIIGVVAINGIEKSNV